MKHLSLDYWIALNLLQDDLQWLGKRAAILFSVCMVHFLINERLTERHPVCEVFVQVYAALL